MQRDSVELWSLEDALHGAIFPRNEVKMPWICEKKLNLSDERLNFVDMNRNNLRHNEANMRDLVSTTMDVVALQFRFLSHFFLHNDCFPLGLAVESWKQRMFIASSVSFCRYCCVSAGNDGLSFVCFH